MNPIDWQIAGILGGALAFAGVILELARRDRKKWDAFLSEAMEGLEDDEVEEEIEEEEPEPDQLPEFNSLEEIHAHYAAMKETDPKAAGDLMYQAQLRLHGK